jgi:hypothetical protein
MNGCRADNWNAALLCVMLSAAAASAETPPPRLQQPIGSRVVLVTVTDTGNRPLVELEPDDFVVDESGQTREILSLHMADYPIAVLLDNTDAAAQDLETIRRAVARFISRVGERSIAVGTLTDPANLIASFDDDRATVLERVRTFSAGATAAPLALQSTAHAARAVRDTGSPFAAIVIVSARSVGASQATDGQFLTPILESGAAVYVIANRPPSTASTASSPENDDVLRVVAEQTHGQYTTIYSPASYSIALDRLADRLATEMMIEYIVPGGAPLTGDVRVGVRIPGARATGMGVSK